MEIYNWWNPSPPIMQGTCFIRYIDGLVENPGNYIDNKRQTYLPLTDERRARRLLSILWAVVAVTYRQRAVLYLVLLRFVRLIFASFCTILCLIPTGNIWISLLLNPWKVIWYVSIYVIIAGFDVCIYHITGYRHAWHMHAVMLRIILLCLY